MHDSPDDLLEVAIDELRRRYDSLRADYDQARVKILTILGGGLAVLSFLYLGGSLFIPSEVYGKIFYLTGLGLALFGLVVLFLAIRPSRWGMPVEMKEIVKLKKHYATKNDFLEYLREDYIETLNICSELHAKKVRYLDTGTISLFIGAIILIVIKYFGG